MFRRIVPLAVIFSLLWALCPAPARATNTPTEIEMGRSEDEQIVSTNVIETDPLLNAYVQGIANNLWKEVARKDVPYNLKIVKDSDPNSFATLGGYVYINEGMIDFVNSDDELAGVIGHETGHIERRHVLTSNSKAQALQLLFGVASFFSPLIYNFGNIMMAGIFAKVQRADELQADRTGLQLMSRAGYDPDAMKTMLEHLNMLADEHSDIVNKYLEDHPEPAQRVAHLEGYPELDPKTVTEQQLTVQAAGDAERARYEYSMLKFQYILKTDPDNAEALLGIGQDQIALGFPNKSQQTLAQAAQKGNPETRDLANQRILALRQLEGERVNLLHPNLDHLKAQFAAVQTAQTQANTEITDRRTESIDQLKQFHSRLEALNSEVPWLDTVQPQHGSRTESLLKNISVMGRSINSALDDINVSINGVGSLERNKESGLLRESSEILKEMDATINSNPIPPESAVVLPSYPSMFNELTRADSDMIRTVDAARASLTMLDQSLGDLDAFFKEARLAGGHEDFRGDIPQSTYDDLVPLEQKVMTGFNNAATAASQAAQLYNMARVRQLSSRITLLGVGTSPGRYSTLQYALNARFKSTGVDYMDMLKRGVTPGDVTIATILAADIKSTPEEILDEMASTNKSPVDLADSHGMHAWPLEIFTGLIYLDYTDNPQTEMHPT